MLISPPFIPNLAAGESDEAFIDRAMQGGNPGDGGFPLSFDLNWHGGIHLNAPREGLSILPVRAIADATLAYFRMPIDETIAPNNHGLRYQDKWTDNGCIVLKHETEIGEGLGATVTFYSIYMHLSKVTLTNPVIGQKIYRKDELGYAGRIYGKDNLIHFEIIADQSQINKLIGRSERLLNHQAKDGRKDSCWGDTYFFLPTEIFAYQDIPNNFQQSQNDTPIVYRCPSIPSELPAIQEDSSIRNNRRVESPPLVQGYDWALAHQLQEGIFIRMRYEHGQCTLTSLLLSGEEIGSRQEEQDYEYKLYKIASQTYPRCPSAGFELLRFGRVLGEDELQPADVAHWRQIALPSRLGEAPKLGWVNLNAPTVTKFSDADFPNWQGWQLIDDDNDSNSHCQSIFIRNLLRLNDTSLVSEQADAVSIALSSLYPELPDDEKLKLSDRYANEQLKNEAALRDTGMQKNINRLICKFPTEWKKDDFDIRYGWLKKVSPHGPFTDDDYNLLAQHHQELAFWEEAGLNNIDSKHWHFPPKEFIKIFRRCGWLSANELAQCIPRKVIEQTTSHNSIRIFPKSTITWNTAITRARRFATPLSKSLRKYLIDSNKERLSYFLANAIQETVYLSRTSESNGPRLRYAPWYGRGVLQLTWEANYKIYTRFRNGSEAPIICDTVETDLNHACESAGFYWISTAKEINSSICLNRYADRRPVLELSELSNVCTNYNYRQKECSTSLSSSDYYICQALERVARGVNTGNPESTGTVNGLIPRRVVFSNCLLVLTEHKFPQAVGDTFFPNNIERQIQ